MKIDDALIITSAIAIVVLVIILLSIVNQKIARKLFDTQPLTTQIIALKIEVDILKGQMQTYQNVPIDLRSRIEVLETRYDNIIFFKDDVNRCEDNILNKGE